MIHDQSTTIEQQLSQITDMLILNGTLMECPGLIHGKIGIAIFFFHYAQYTNNMLFADYAIDLIATTQSQIHINSPADYEKGIAGIGVGIDYLVHNKFLIVEDDICEDFDQRMYRAVMYEPWQNFNKYDGLTGYGQYWISRLHYQVSSTQARECLLYITRSIKEQLSEIPIEEQVDVYCFLHDLQRISDFDNCIGLMERCEKQILSSSKANRYFSHLGDSITGNIVRKYQSNRYFNNSLQCEIDNDFRQIPDINMEKPPENMGLLTGYAGEGLLRLTLIRQTNYSWMFLL